MSSRRWICWLKGHFWNVPKRLVQAAAVSLALAGCSSAPGSHETICTDHEVLCVVAGIAVFGGIVAVMQESGDNDDHPSTP